jgi:hypothetical protein
MAPDGSRRIVWMIIGMIKAHPTQNRMPRQARGFSSFRSPTVALAVEPVRVGWQDREVAAVDVFAVKVWRRRDTKARVRGVTVLCRRSGSRRPWSAGRMVAGLGRRVVAVVGATVVVVLGDWSDRY